MTSSERDERPNGPRQDGHFATPGGERAISGALGELARELAGGTDHDVVLGRLVEHVRGLVQADVVVLALAEEGATEARVVARAGPGSARSDDVVFRPGDDGPAGRVLAGGTTVVSDGDDGTAPDAAEPGRAVAAAPVAIGDRLAGVLLADRRSPGPFRVDEVRTIELFAHHAALGARFWALGETIQARAEDVAVLQRIGLDLSRSLDLPSILGSIAEAARRRTGSDVACCAVVDPFTRESEILARAGMAATGPTRSRLHPGEGIGGRLLRDRRPFRAVRAPGGDPGAWADDPIASEQGLTAMLAVPVLDRDALIGFLWVGNRSRRSFSEPDEEFLSGLAADVAVAIANARAHAERDRALDELRASQERVVRAERLRALGEMASGVAHDFNNLLAVILGRAQLLMLRSEDPQLRRGLTVIEAAATEAAQTVRRIHEFTRTRQGGPYVAVDLAQVLDQAVDLTKGRWKGEAQIDGVTYSITTEVPATIHVPGDLVELRELFANLLLNAFDAMPEGGRVSLVARPESSRVVVVEVRDTGPGMPRQVRERVFEPFFTTKGPRRTGLGLSVAYGITQRHGGTIEVDSQEGRGTTFTVSLPRIATAGHAAVETSLAAGPAGDSARVLLIEDEPMVGEILVDLLRAAGHAPLWAMDGLAGLDLIDPVAPPDVALVDLGLPGMSGLELAGRIQAAHPGVPIVLVTGWADRIDPEALRRSGITQVVAKPFRNEEILRIVAAATAERRAGQSPAPHASG